MRENLLPLHCEGSLSSSTCADFRWELEHGWTLLSMLEFLMGMCLPQGMGEHFWWGQDGDRDSCGAEQVPREGVEGCAVPPEVTCWPMSPFLVSFKGQRALSGITSFHSATWCSFPSGACLGCVNRRLCLSTAPGAT